MKKFDKNPGPFAFLKNNAQPLENKIFERS